MGQDTTDIVLQIWDKATNIQEGTLDVLSAQNFPLAISYTIKDVQDIEKSKGTFTKTFKIPATENNNRVLKNIVYEGTYNASQIIEGKTAKVYQESQLILEGGFKLKSVTQNDIVKHYECVIFGENFEWVNQLDKLPLCEIDLTVGNNFPDHPTTWEYTRDNVWQTWYYENGLDIRGGVGTWFIFPLVNTGKWNGHDAVDYTDLLPSWFIYNLVTQIFAGQGYTLVSNFFETNWFKKLVTLFPIAEDAWEVETSTSTDSSFNFGIGQTNWKIPINYRNIASLGNTFDGAIQYANMTAVGPNFDSTGQWSSSNIQPKTRTNPAATDASVWDFRGTYGGVDIAAIGSHRAKTIAGYWWMWYGRDCGYVPHTVPPMFPSICFSGLISHGYGWDCILQFGTGDTVYSGFDCNTTPDTSEDIMTDVAVFKPDTLQEYTLNIEVETEMDYQYIIDNEPDPYDCRMCNNSTIGGFYGYHQGYQQYDSYSGEEGRGDFYWHRLWLMHEHHDENYTEAIHLDTNGVVLPAGMAIMNWYNAAHVNRRLTQNHICILEASNVLIEPVDLEDRYWLYVEVTSNTVEYELGADKVTGSCQCKYRINRGTIGGGLSGSQTTTTTNVVDVAGLLPCDTTQLDYVNGLTGLFNLYWKADEINKVIYVEPRDNFFTGVSSAVDWSDKITMHKDQKDQFIYDALNRDLCFTYENDGSDGFVDERNKLVGQICELDSFVMDLGDLYKDKESKIGTNFYTPSYMFRDGVIANNQQWAPYMPVIHSEYSLIWTNTDPNAYPDKVTNFGPRILYWAGKIPLNPTTGSDPNLTWRFMSSNGVSYGEYETYPAVITYADWSRTYMGQVTIGGESFYPTLPYNDLATTAQVPQPTPPATHDYCDGLYRVFWERGIENLIKRPRLKVAFFNLNSNDIANLDLRRLVYLDADVTGGNTYWIINKIVDYKPNKNELTKVELHQYIVALPTKRIHKSNSHGKYTQQNEVRGQQSLDYVSNNLRNSDNNVSLLGGFGNKRFTVLNQPNVNNLSRRWTQSNGESGQQTTYDNTQIAHGGMATGKVGNKMVRVINRDSLKGVNVGQNNNVIEGANQIAIGKGLSNMKQGVIYIGEGNALANVNHPIQIIQNGVTALAVDNAGNVLEGGGGAIMAQDAAGNYYEIYYQDIQASMGNTSTNVRKVLKSN